MNTRVEQQEIIEPMPNFWEGKATEKSVSEENGPITAANGFSSSVPFSKITSPSSAGLLVLMNKINHGMKNKRYTLQNNL